MAARTALRRAEKNERTRSALLDAARRVFVERGFHDTSLDAVADAAGLTKGAVYSRFASKADLFLALLAERIDERIVQIRSIVGSGSVAADVGAAARQWNEVLRTDLAWTLLVIEFRVHVARQPELNRRYAELHDRFLGACADAIAAAMQAAGVEQPRRVDEIAWSLLALNEGVALERAAQPDSYSEALLDALNQTLLTRGLARG